MAHWNGKSWWLITDFKDVRSISMTNPTHGWAVGAGQILRWQGQSWTREPRTEDLHTVLAISDSHAVAVGASGVILENRGPEWVRINSGTDQTLRALTVDQKHLWLGGDGGALLTRPR